MRLRYLIVMLPLLLFPACGDDGSGPENKPAAFTVNGADFYDGHAVLEVAVIDSGGNAASGTGITVTDLSAGTTQAEYKGHTGRNGKLYIHMTAAESGYYQGIFDIQTDTLMGQVIYTIHEGGTTAPTNRVYFQRNGGSYVSTVQVHYATVMTEPPVPIRQGYVFMGWYADEEFLIQWDFAQDRVYSIMWLFARWKPQVFYTINLDLQGGTTSGSTYISVLSGNRLQKPADPVRAGYVFLGWYADSTLRLPWDFSITKVEGNMTLYAGWTAL